LEEIEVGGTIILQRGFKCEREKFNYIVLVQDGYNTSAFVNTDMKIAVPKMGACF